MKFSEFLGHNKADTPASKIVLQRLSSVAALSQHPEEYPSQAFTSCVLRDATLITKRKYALMTIVVQQTICNHCCKDEIGCNRITANSYSGRTRGCAQLYVSTSPISTSLTYQTHHHNLAP